MSERWRPVRGYERFYEVSTRGRVRTVQARSRWPAGKILAPQPDSDGYPSLRLWKGGKGKRMAIHRLVLTAYVGPRPKGRQCRHLDGDRTNSELANLAWGTSRENGDDTRRHGSLRGQRNGRAKLTKAEAQAIRNGTASPVELAERFDVDASQVRRIQAGRRWGHLAEGA
jgi:hypothetical protein